MSTPGDIPGTGRIGAWFSSNVSWKFGAFALLASALPGAAWVAAGGVAPGIAALRALNDPHVSAAVQALNREDDAAILDGLPDALSDISRSLESLNGRLDDSETERDVLLDAIEQLADTIDVVRADNTAIVEWAQTRSQTLTDERSRCFPGAVCTVYLRGHRTPQGLECELTAADPRLLLPGGPEEGIPIQFAEGYVPPQLGLKYETIAAEIRIPSFVTPGSVGMFLVTYYANCPFAGEDRVVERSTFVLRVLIRDPEDRG